MIVFFASISGSDLPEEFGSRARERGLFAIQLDPKFFDFGYQAVENPLRLGQRPIRMAAKS